MNVISRQEAKQRGLKRYFTGKPCKHGHVSERLVSNGCIECNRIANQSAQQKARRKIARLRPHRQATEKVAQQEYKSRPVVRARLTAYARARSRRLKGLPSPTRPCPSRCEICQQPSHIALHLDHCHVTGKFRGWLCGNCNLGLGNFRDSLTSLEAARRYLERTDG